MITYALLHKAEVEAALAKLQASAAAEHFSPVPYFEPTKIEDSTWGRLQLVAVHEGKVQGYLSASIDRNTQSIDSLCMAKFCEGHDEQMAADIATIFRYLLKHFRSVRWTCTGSSPLRRIYEKIAIDFGGRSVGVLEKACRLPVSGLIDDTIIFQVMGNNLPDGLTSLPESFGT